MEQLLEDLKALGIKLRAEGDDLRISAPPGALTDGLRTRLREQKPALLALLRNDRQAEIVTPRVEVDIEHRGDPFPLTELQHAYWLGRDSAVDMGSVATHLYVEFDAGHLDIERLGEALRRMIERHDMLRAVACGDGMQRILPTVPRYEIAVEDWSAASAEQAEHAAQLTREALSHQVLDPQRWPLFDVRATLLPGRGLRLHVSLDLLILDALSIQLFFREWGLFYARPELKLRPLGLSFRDYVLAERKLQASNTFDVARAYWMERIESLPASPDLPMRAPATRGAPRFSRREARLDRNQWSALKSKARDFGLTPSCALLAAYSEVLARWSATPHFTVNVTVSSRLPVHDDVNQLLGDFVSPMLHEVDRRDAQQNFAAFAQALQKRFQLDVGHSQMNGLSVMREWARQRGLALQATMPVVFSCVLNAEDAEGTGHWGQFGPRVHCISQTSQVWLDHHVMEQDGALLFNWDAIDERFEDGVLDAMFGAFCDLLRRLADEEGPWFGTDVVPLPAAMLQRREQDATAVHEQPLPALHAGLVEHALRSPQATALISASRTLTYAELLSESTAVADSLRGQGLQAGQPVAVLMHKGWEQVVAVYGVLLAGGAYLPVDAGLPIKRQLELLRLGEAAQVLVQPDTARAEVAAAGHALHELRAGAQAGFKTIHQASLAAPPDRLAYIIFTSGTTGVPKGVMIDHRGAASTVRQVNRLIGTSAQDRVLGVSSLSFDLSVYDIFGLHAAGGALVLPDPRMGHDPVHWSELMLRHGVTLWNSAPQLMRMLMDSYQPDERDAAPLRTVLLSGDFIPLDLPERIRQRHAAAEVISLGGATEASIWSIYHRIANIDPGWPSIPYGKALPDQRILVCDSALRACPDHVRGRIHIGGIGLAQGYWRDEAKTAARFVTHPQTGERWYDTGDLGRYSPDGTVFILGRDDGQIKIRGHRIELGEIEAALRAHGGVRQALVLPTEGASDSRQLVAYVELCDEAVDAGLLQQHLAERLPEYMLPRHIVAIDAMPVTPNGKIDRAALPAVVDDTRACSVAPRNDVERTMLEVWSRVITGCEIGVTDNFFELGGDSVMATQLLRELNAALPFRLQMHELFETLTIEALACLYEGRANRVQEEDCGPMLADVEAAQMLFDRLDFSAAPSKAALANTIFVTGATGWVGSHVLRALLSRTDAKLLCLVRAASQAEGHARLLQALRDKAIDVSPSWAARIEAVCGDLAQPELGLGAHDWARIAQSADAIYHLGASVNVLKDYTAQRAVNVMPAVAVVRLAVEHRLKPVFFVSPMAVSRRRGRDGLVVLPGEESCADPDGLLTGYAQSKWAAERILVNAAQRGLSLRIYRSSHALPAAHNGRGKTDDTYAVVLQAARAAGVVPDWSEGCVSGVPVDLLGQLLVDDSLIDDGHGGVVHIENRTPLSLAAVIEAQLVMQPTVRVSLDEWKTRCIQASTQMPDEHAALAAMLFADRAGGTAVEHMFSRHPIETSRFERLGLAARLSNMTPADYWRRVARAASA